MSQTKTSINTQSDQDITKFQMFQNDNDNAQNDQSKEVELPTPEKKNEEITTGNNNAGGEKAEENTGQTGKTDTNGATGNGNKSKTGFDVENVNEQNKDKRGNEPERLERDNTTSPKTKDADWQQDKMNEANNQQGNKKNVNVNEHKNLNDTRNDSILDRPKTETYEKGQGEDVGGKIKEENNTHRKGEQKRDDLNRQQRAKNADKSGITK